MNFNYQDMRFRPHQASGIKQTEHGVILEQLRAMKPGNGFKTAHFHCTDDHIHVRHFKLDNPVSFDRHTLRPVQDWQELKTPELVDFIEKISLDNPANVDLLLDIMDKVENKQVQKALDIKLEPICG